MPAVATRRGGGVDLCTRAARSAMPEVATRLFGVSAFGGGLSWEKFIGFLLLLPGLRFFFLKNPGPLSCQGLSGDPRGARF